MKSIMISNFPALDYSADEAINTLCTNLSFSGVNTKIIMVTSCHAHEGKSFISMNIMRTMAALGKQVALVDGDLRRSEMYAVYGLQFPAEKSFGLSHYLAGMVNREDVLYSTNIPGAYLIPAGKEVKNPLPLLASSRFDELLKFLSGNMDYVIVDAPPVGMVIDAAEIAKSCDGILITVQYDAVRRRELLDVKEQLEQTGCPILGTVMNQVQMDGHSAKKYYYRSYYYRSHYDSYYGYSESEKKKK